MAGHAVGPKIRRRKKSGGKRKSKQFKPAERTSAVTLTRAEWRVLVSDVKSAIEWTVDNCHGADSVESADFMHHWRHSLSVEITEQHPDKGDDDAIAIERSIDDWAHIAGLAFRGKCKGRWSELMRQYSAAAFGGEGWE